MTDYVLAAYILGASLLWGYAIVLWFESRAVARRATNLRKSSGGTP